MAHQARGNPTPGPLGVRLSRREALKLAAAALGIHPHTLSYRLSQIQRHFGLDLDDVETRLRVHLAVLILDN